TPQVGGCRAGANPIDEEVDGDPLMGSEEHRPSGQAATVDETGEFLAGDEAYEQRSHDQGDGRKDRFEESGLCQPRAGDGVLAAYAPRRRHDASQAAGGSRPVPPSAGARLWRPPCRIGAASPAPAEMSSPARMGASGRAVAIGTSWATQQDP